MSANVRVFAWDAVKGELTLLQSISSDDPGYSGNRSAAEIAVSQDGRFVYVSNRSDEAMVVFAIDPGNGSLRVIQRASSGGKLPWHFALHSSGRWMIVANRDSNTLALFLFPVSTNGTDLRL